MCFFFLSVFFFFKFFFNTGDPVTEQSHSCLSLPPPSLLSSARNLWSGLRVPRPRKTMSRRLACLWNSLSRRRRQPPPPPLRCNANLIFTSFIPVFRAVQSAPDLYSSPSSIAVNTISRFTRSRPRSYIYMYVYIFGLA